MPSYLMLGQNYLFTTPLQSSYQVSFEAVVITKTVNIKNIIDFSIRLSQKWRTLFQYSQNLVLLVMHVEIMLG